MCTSCGCGEGEVKFDDHVHEHHHLDSNSSRMVKIEQDILAKNNKYAASNRVYLAERGIMALNLVSSPGSGKTTLLTNSICHLKSKQGVAVIEGDQQTSNDAERIRGTGVQAIQINTGKGCHLDGHMVGHAFQKMSLEDNSIIFIENVGNLVCPAEFDLGEAHKVVILSVTEGEDKPLKYQGMFNAADLVILNKVDLLPYLDFDIDKCIDYINRINPKAKVLQLSAKTGEGMDTWYAWIDTAFDLYASKKENVIPCV